MENLEKITKDFFEGLDNKYIRNISLSNQVLVLEWQENDTVTRQYLYAPYIRKIKTNTWCTINTTVTSHDALRYDIDCICKIEINVYSTLVEILFREVGQYSSKFQILISTEDEND